MSCQRSIWEVTQKLQSEATILLLTVRQRFRQTMSLMGKTRFSTTIAGAASSPSLALAIMFEMSPKRVFRIHHVSEPDSTGLGQ